MSSYAMFRLPYEDKYTIVRQTRGEVQRLNSLAELNGREGFVIAPFDVEGEQSILLLRPDEVEVLDIKPKEVDISIKERISASPITDNRAGENKDSCPQVHPSTADYKQQYSADFARFHAPLVSGEFNKIVLARRVHIANEGDIAVEELFHRACALYPRVFVALVSTPQSGVWLVATPEILLKGDGNSWRTIALAGTMRYDNTGEWTDKNKAEQGYVADYMRNNLSLFADNIIETAPYKVRAGGLIHLRSDFDFTLKDASLLGDVLQKLHPTPAVCGLPKEATRRFIIENEQCPRKYYSGFMGMLSPCGDTNLYVSLRCMCITGSGYSLYAGGGLLADSAEEEEWAETEAKLEMMKGVITNI